MEEIDFKGIGERLRAYRVENSLSPNEIASILNISRSAVYRLESGEIVKIDTLSRLADLFNTSISTLLGFGVEYYSYADGFFERMRQLEGMSNMLYSHFDPFSYLLTSDDYDYYLRKMIIEGDHSDILIERLDNALKILKKRKKSKHHPKVRNLISSIHLERFLYIGLVGTLDLPPSVKMTRVLKAREEIKHLLTIVGEDETNEIAVTREPLPSVAFQIYFNDRGSMALSLSPFRLSELPSLSNGIASVTSAKEVVVQYKNIFDRLWDKAAKGDDAKMLIKDILDKY